MFRRSHTSILAALVAVTAIAFPPVQESAKAGVRLRIEIDTTPNSPDDQIAEQRFEKYERDVAALLDTTGTRLERLIADTERRLIELRDRGNSRSRLMKVVSGARKDAGSITKSAQAQLNRLAGTAFIDLRRMDAKKSLVDAVHALRRSASGDMAVLKSETIAALDELVTRVIGPA